LSVLPEILESIRSHFGVSNRVHDISVAHGAVPAGLVEDQDRVGAGGKGLFRIGRVINNLRTAVRIDDLAIAEQALELRSNGEEGGRFGEAYFVLAFCFAITRSKAATCFSVSESSISKSDNGRERGFGPIDDAGVLACGGVLGAGADCAEEFVGLEFTLIAALTRAREARADSSEL